MSIVTKAFLRYVRRRRSLSLLQLLGVACGVAAAVGMAFSAQAALSSFTRAVEFLKGKATHSLSRSAGPMEEMLLIPILRDPAVVAFSPIIDRRLRLPSGDVVRVLGIDPFLDRAVRPDIGNVSFAGEKKVKEALSFLLDDRTALVDAGLQARLGIKQGGTFTTTTGVFRVGGTFPNPGGEPLMLIDISRAQQLFRLYGQVDRVDLILNDPQGFQSRWSQGFLVQSSQQQRATLGDMLKSFRLNLEALSLLALFVGVFLVYNTAMFAVVTRRKDAGILMSLGASRSEIMLAFLTEILLLGSLGGALGGGLGYVLSRFLTTLLGKTISSLYFFLRPTLPAWSWDIMLYGVIVGCGAGLIGGLFPLAELVRTDPIRAMQGRTASYEGGKKAGKLAIAGVAFLALSFSLLTLTSLHVYWGFAGTFCLLLGASLFCGIAVKFFTQPLKVLFGLLARLPGKVAAGNIRKNLGRTAVAVAAFMVALSASVGLGSMIGSFRHSLMWWMETQLKGDLYVAPSAETEVPEACYEEIKKIPGVGGVDPYRNAQVIYRGVPIRITAVDPSTLQKFTHFGWLQGGNENWDKVKEGAVIVSESFYRRFGLGPGDSVTLEGATGPVALQIAAVFYDYTTEHGLIMISRETYLRIFHDHTIDSLAIFIDPRVPDRSSVIGQARRKAQGWGLPVVTQAELHRNILSVFDSTFAVTRSMRILAVIVAFFGIAGAILTLFIERQREFGIYRALGFSTTQVATMTLMEGLGMGLVSFLLSTVVGTALAYVLIRVINFHSFNWTIFYYPQAEPYLVAAATAVLASIGAALYPIWKICRTYPQMQIHEE